MRKRELDRVLKAHRKWLEDPDQKYAKKANLSNTNLSEADLNGVNLRGADLSNTNLSGANLSGANLSEADLSGVNLRGADLSNTNLSEADLRGADISGANLSEANLSEANLDFSCLPLWCGSLKIGKTDIKFIRQIAAHLAALINTLDKDDITININELYNKCLKLGRESHISNHIMHLPTLLK